MEGDGRPNRCWAVESTAALWQKRGGGRFRQNNSLVLVAWNKWTSRKNGPILDHSMGGYNRTPYMSTRIYVAGLFFIHVYLSKTRSNMLRAQK